MSDQDRPKAQIAWDQHCASLVVVDPSFQGLDWHPMPLEALQGCRLVQVEVQP
jgi:hypothetical protein